MNLLSNINLFGYSDGAQETNLLLGRYATGFIHMSTKLQNHIIALAHLHR
jgi:hypothetical protein